MNAIDFLESKIEAGIVPNYNKVHHAEIMEEYVNLQNDIVDNSDGAYICNRTAFYTTLIINHLNMDYNAKLYYDASGVLHKKTINIKDLKAGEFIAMSVTQYFEFLSRIPKLEFWSVRAKFVNNDESQSPVTTYMWSFETESILIDSYDSPSIDDLPLTTISELFKDTYETYTEAYQAGILSSSYMVYELLVNDRLG